MSINNKQIVEMLQLCNTQLKQWREYSDFLEYLIDELIDWKILAKRLQKLVYKQNKSLYEAAKERDKLLCLIDKLQNKAKKSIKIKAPKRDAFFAVYDKAYNQLLQSTNFTTTGVRYSLDKKATEIAEISVANIQVNTWMDEFLFGTNKGEYNGK